MARPDRHWLTAIGFTAALVLLVAFAVTDVVSGFVGLLPLTVIAAAASFYRLFPRSRSVAIAFANLIAVYACTFIFFVESNFASAHGAVVPVGFILPVMAFLLGVAVRRRDIRAIVTAETLREERNLIQVLGWLVPIFAIGGLTFLIPAEGWSEHAYDGALLAAMLAISIVVSLVSRDVATFLLDAAILFDEFFKRVSRLMIPAFAFFTFYSLLVIVFGSLYRIVDRLSPEFMFRVGGVPQRISFPESLYFSIVTLSTVGYGDIVPAANLTRILVAVQIVCGILLLLFGFSEIIAYSRDRRAPRAGE
jgi:voltage-gated potassium channel